jgi:hypothetical protein
MLFAMAAQLLYYTLSGTIWFVAHQLDVCAFLQEQEDGAGGPGQFPYLLALHALCAADASLATPKADPQRFVRCLAPYISAAGVQQGILARTNSGEEPGVARETAVVALLVS